MPWRIWESGNGARLYVGSADDAVRAGGHVARIVNCANVDYPYAPACSRRWLNLNFRNSS